MYNLHCHSLLSDGVLLPSEVAARYAAVGYKIIAITDHVDYSNIELVIKSIREFTAHWPSSMAIKVLAGIELTHLPLEQFKPLVRYARKQGIKIIVGHGETLAEPVIKGTNRAALEAGIDILAHPGLITDAEIRLAIKQGVFLEITSRSSHKSSNHYVVGRALKLGADLILGTDSHQPEDIITPDELKNVGRKAGLSQKKILEIYRKLDIFLGKVGGRLNVPKKEGE